MALSYSQLETVWTEGAVSARQDLRHEKPGREHGVLLDVATFSYAQLESLWEQANGPAAVAPIMAAIGMAESGGNSNAIGPGGSFNIWQIQPQYHPDMPPTSDPLTGAEYAVQIYKEQGLSAWSTYNEGTYKKFYSPGTVPATAASARSSTMASGGAQSAGPCLWNVGSFCADSIVGVGGITGGAILLIVAGFLIFV